MTTGRHDNETKLKNDGNSIEARFSSAGFSFYETLAVGMLTANGPGEIRVGDEVMVID